MKDKIHKQIYIQMGDRIDIQVCDKVSSKFRNQSVIQLWNIVYRRLQKQVMNQVRTDKTDKIMVQIKNQFRER